MSEPRSYLYVCQTASNVDCDQGGNVGDRKTVGRNELMSVQFLIHPFKTLINDRALRLAIFRELL
jgi:hypothetical protein